MSDASSVHPIFQRILEDHQRQPVDLRLAAYKAVLARMDWTFASSDDQRSIAAGNVALAYLRAEQKMCDASGDLWRAAAGNDPYVPQPPWVAL